ncbi:MAG TPA: 50S ribosomal protein L11 methyltransferase, partial [Verrucomicrobiae bacterium]|nr:50S ribosomal protein L11 methyltransferase [Verrucomicrobiae bacterium]
MKQASLWRISVPVQAEAEEAVSELLESVFGAPPVAWHDARTGRTVVSAYVDTPSDWSNQARAQLETGLARIRQHGVALGKARIQATRLRHEDWAESWKRHFRAMEFGRALLVKPSWVRRRPRAGQQVVVLDPGLSFGTGQHPTTGFCLEQIVAGRTPGKAQSLLDIGTGSGILAIAAVKLGYRPVVAYDADAEAVRVARANARQNGVARRLQLAQRDLTREPLRIVQKFDMVCANLILDLLLSERDRIVNRVRPGGALVLAGILRTQFPA